MIKIYEEDKEYIDKYLGSEIYFTKGKYVAMVDIFDPFSGQSDKIPIYDTDLDKLKQKIDKRLDDYMGSVSHWMG